MRDQILKVCKLMSPPTGCFHLLFKIHTVHAVVAYEHKHIGYYFSTCLYFSFFSEFKRQLSILSEEDNQCTIPTSEHEHKMKWNRIICNYYIFNFILYHSASDPRAPTSRSLELSTASEWKRDVHLGVEVVKTSAG